MRRFFISHIRDILFLVLITLVVFYVGYVHYRVHVQSTRELQDCYYRGTVIDRGVIADRSTYRWIIADWVTLDGEAIGRREINAAGFPIHRIKVGDVICSSTPDNLRGLTLVNCATGFAYYPTQLSFIDVMIVVMSGILIWGLVLFSFFRFLGSLHWSSLSS